MKMKTIFSVLILMLSMPVPVQAESKMFLSPTRINLNERYKVETVNISNVTGEPHTYKVQVKDLVMTEKGTTVASDNSEFSAKKMIRYFPREFTVQPGKHQTVRVMAKIPADTLDGEYHSHIEFFEDVPKSDTSEKPAGEASKARLKASFSYSTLLPITVSKGAIDTKIGFAETSVKRSEKPNTYKIDIVFSREGNGQGNAYFDTFYVTPSGQTQIGKRRTVYIYREIDRKDYSLEAALPEGASPGGKIKLVLFTGDRAHPKPVTETILDLP